MRPPTNDPYWEGFINRAPFDSNNVIPHGFKQVQPGGVNPVRTEVHSPNVMSSHVKELARFYGADAVGIVSLTDGNSAIVCGMRSDYDTRTAVGVGGQTPAMKGLFAMYTLSCYIRELGYAADLSDADRERLALAAGVGGLKPFMHVADVVVTDLPLEPDGRA